MEIKSVKSRNNQGCHKANVLIHMTDSDHIGLIIKEEITIVKKIFPLTPPPPHFWKVMLQIFNKGYCRIYVRRQRPDSIG